MTVTPAVKTEGKITKGILLVAAENVTDNGRCSFKYLFEAKIPYDIMSPYFGYWGYIELRRKEANHVDPFKLVRGELGAVGDDGTLRWNCNIFNSTGLKMNGSIDSNGLWIILKDIAEEIPLFSMLVEKTLVERIMAAAKEVEIPIAVFYSEVALATS